MKSNEIDSNTATLLSLLERRVRTAKPLYSVLQFMRNHPKANTSQKSRISTFHKSNQYILTPSKYGPILLRVPAELLSNCTSYLEPQALFLLGLCNRQLFEHVSDDNTWHSAFMSYFFGIGPNDAPPLPRETLIVRRTEATWKREFIHRHTMLQRLGRSRDSTISHVPCISEVSATYFLDKDQALLSASTQYGIVARSVPVTGKVLKGYLTASSPLLGIGNPNMDFTPNVLSIAIGPVASPSGACVLWGCQSGEVSLTCALRVMDGVRTQTRYFRCTATDEHAHPVVQTLCVNVGLWATADTFGRIKLWEGTSKCLRCLWTSQEDRGQTCVQLKAEIGIGKAGVVVAAYACGKVVVWYGFPGDLLQGSSAPSNIREVTIEPLLGPSNVHTSKEVDCIKLFLDPLSTEGRLVIGMSLQSVIGAGLSRWEVDFSPPSPRTQHVVYADGQLDTITCLEPSFSNVREETAFVLAGDKSGKVALWLWDKRVEEEVRSLKWIQAHDDGGVTAMAVSDTVIVSGSEGGSVALHCAATLAPIRVFSSGRSNRDGVSDAVMQITLREHVLLWNVGIKIFCWPVGELSKSVRTRNKRKSKSFMKNPAKGIDVQELKADIRESNRMLSYEKAQVRTSHQRLADHNRVLDDLGLSEAEAVEYALMLSLETARSEADYDNIPEEGMFLEDERMQSVTALASKSPPSPSVSSSLDDTSIPSSWVGSPHSNAQVGSHWSPERPSLAAEAGIPLENVNMPEAVPHGDMAAFPAISTSFNHRPSQLNWSTVMRSHSHPGESTLSSSLSTADKSLHPAGKGSSSLQDSSEEMDADLRYALRLSLMDANRRSEE